MADKTHDNAPENINTNFEITAKGSLGLLALGDIGLRAWRKVKQKSLKKDTE